MRSTTVLLGVLLASACGPASWKDIGDDEEDIADEVAAITAPVPSTGSLRPTFRDISLKTELTYEWYRGRVATNTQRDAMEQTALMAMAEAFRYARTMPSCSGIMDRVTGDVSVILHRLGTGGFYDDILGPPRGIWEVHTSGRHYSIERHSLQRIRDCSVSAAGAPLCAGNPLMTHDPVKDNQLADLLDIRVENGKCLPGARFALPARLEPFSSVRAKVGVASARVAMGPLDDRDLQLLHATHAAHMAVSRSRCGGPVPARDAVEAAHRAFEDAARDEADHHFRRMKDFSGYADTIRNGNPRGWTDEEECQWAQIQDRFHEAWMRGIEAGDWGVSRRAETAHQLAHFCMNFKDAPSARQPLVPKFACSFDPSRDIDECPKLTCAQYLRSQFPQPTPGPTGEAVPVGGACDDEERQCGANLLCYSGNCLACGALQQRCCANFGCREGTCYSGKCQVRE